MVWAGEFWSSGKADLIRRRKGKEAGGRRHDAGGGKPAPILLTWNTSERGVGATVGVGVAEFWSSGKTQLVGGRCQEAGDRRQEEEANLLLYCWLGIHQRGG